MGVTFKKNPIGNMDHRVSISPLLASALKSQRQRIGLTQIQVANKAGLLPKTVSALENTPERATIDSMLKLVAALELDLVLRPKKQKAKTEW